MSKGGSPQQANNDPWGEVQPYLKDLYASASQQFNEGAQDYYPDQAYLDPNSMQQQGVTGMSNYADDLAYRQTGLWDAQNQGLSGTNAMMGAYGGKLGQSAGVYGDIMGGQGSQYGWGQMGNTQATRALQGQMNPNGGNPYLNSMISQGQQQMADTFNTDVMSNIRDEAIMTGQLGGSNQGQAVDKASENLLKQMSDYDINMRGSQYQADQSRALQAASTGAGMEMGVGSQNLGANQFNTQARMNAAGDIGSMYGSGLGMGNDLMGRTMAMSPSLYQAGAMPSQMLSQAGNMQEGFDQRQLTDAMNRYYYPQQAQQDMTNWYSNILAGAAPYGSTTQSAPAYNQTQGMLGGGLAGYGAMSALGYANPWIGAGMGALAMYDW